MDRDELYAVALDRFVAERNALAKELRQAGRRDEAGEVAALRKPSVAAWAVNRLAREHEGALRQLLRAGDELIDVQTRVVSGEADGRDLAQAAERERSAVSQLVEQAGALLAREGQRPTQAVLDRVSATLHAAALDVDARPEVQGGRLERELRHVGFWTGSTEAAQGPAARPAKGSPRKAGTAKARAQQDEDAEAAARAARQREAARKDAQAAVTEARRSTARTERAVESAERRRTRAARALRKAEHEDREAQETLAATRGEADEAAQALTAAESELAALTDD